jgi:hypothetical protein
MEPVMNESRFEWVIIDDLVVDISTAGKLPPARWEEFRRVVERSPVRKILATAIGTTEMDSVTRKSASDLAQKKGLKVAAVTDDRLVRGLVTAVSWLGTNVKAFSWEELDKAIVHLDVPYSMQKLVADTAQDLKAKALVALSLMEHAPARAAGGMKK